VRETGFNDGTGAEYFYDDAERLTTVRYSRPSGGTLLRGKRG